MSILIHITYSGVDGNARAFAQEMVERGLVDAIRAQEGNLRYEYYLPFDQPEDVLLVDEWNNQEALDIHHASPLMQEIIALRKKYDLHMRVERYVPTTQNPKDEMYIQC